MLARGTRDQMVERGSGAWGSRALHPRARILRTFGDELTDTLPDLVLDFQQLVTLPRDQMDSLKRLAWLYSPFGEALPVRFARYFGRLGTPDLDLENRRYQTAIYTWRRCDDGQSNNTQWKS